MGALEFQEQVAVVSRRLQATRIAMFTFQQLPLPLPIASQFRVGRIIRMSKRMSAQSCIVVLSFLTFPLLAPAAQKIKIEIVNLTWTVRLGHITSFRAKAILPDGSRVISICQGERC